MIHILSVVQDPDASFPFFGAGNVHGVQPDFLKIWLHFLSRHARSPQLLDSKHPVVVGLEHGLDRYTHEVTTFLNQPDKRCVYALNGAELVEACGFGKGVHKNAGEGGCY